jgi:hypothetical protein
MKTKMWLAAIGCMAAAGSAAVGLRYGVAQESPYDQPTPIVQAQPGQPVLPARPGRRVKSVGQVVVDGSTGKRVVISAGPESIETSHLIEEAAAALHDAKDDEAKADAKAKLSDLLNKYFEDDMKRRQDELAKIEARLKKLRELLDKRREKQREIIDLQMKVLQNEADGLGFFNSGSPEGVPQYPMFWKQTLMHQNPWEGGGGGAGWNAPELPVMLEGGYGSRGAFSSSLQPGRTPAPAGAPVPPKPPTRATWPARPKLPPQPADTEPIPKPAEVPPDEGTYEEAPSDLTPAEGIPGEEPEKF